MSLTMIATCWNQRSLLRESTGTGRPSGARNCISSSRSSSELQAHDPHAQAEEALRAARMAPLRPRRRRPSRTSARSRRSRPTGPCRPPTMLTASTAAIRPGSAAATRGHRTARRDQQPQGRDARADAQQARDAPGISSSSLLLSPGGRRRATICVAGRHRVFAVEDAAPAVQMEQLGAPHGPRGPRRGRRVLPRAASRAAAR